MHIDEKQIDGPDLERTAEKEVLVERKEAGLPEIAGEQVLETKGMGGGELLAVIRRILDHQSLNVSRLGLPQREAIALEALQAAAEGKNATGRFVYAEHRRSMLEQALAVLQPNLTIGDSAQVAELREGFERLTREVGELREHLSNLADAQGELLESERVAQKGETDTGDKPASDPDAPRPPSTLSSGPAVERSDKPSGLSSGPEAKRDEAKSTLSTGQAIERHEKATGIWAEDSMSAEARDLLDRHVHARDISDEKAREALAANAQAERGAREELEAEAAAATGDDKKKKPWWRRPFG